MIAEASAVTAYAQQSAAEAVQAAAVARGAADEAKTASDQAKAAADQAAGYAADARTKADAAATSAQKAAESAKTATAAEASARKSAASAAYSAQKAQASANSAQVSAASAYQSAAQARADAEAAGQDKQIAAQAASNAFQAYTTKHEAEQEAARLAAEEAQTDAKLKAEADAAQKATEANLEAELRKQIGESGDPGWMDTALGIVHGLLDVVSLIPGVGTGAALINCGIYALQKDVANATLACLSAIPLAGDAAAVAKLAKWAEKIPGGSKVLSFLEKLFSKVPGTCLIRPNSFPAGTPVLMADGTARPIEQIRIGDRVLATDPQTGETGPRLVDATIYTPDDREFVDLVVTDGTGNSGSITATAHHPFWSQKRAAWVDAGELTGGETLTAPAGTATVSSARTWSTVQPAYNLTIRGIHTYYVIAGNTPVLVHNTGPACGITTEALESAWKTWNTEENLVHVIDVAKHGFSDIIAKAGGREQALRLVMDSLHGATDLPPGGFYEVTRVIEGEVVTIRGVVIDGVPRLGTAFIRAKFPVTP